MKWFVKVAAASALTVGVLGVGASVASASDPSSVPGAPSEGASLYKTERTLAENRSHCLKAVDKRVRSLAKWRQYVARHQSRGQITAEQRDEIFAIIDSTSSGLTLTARPAIEAADASNIQVACSNVITNYRVYKVVHPKVYLLAAGLAWSNRIDAVETNMVPLASKSVYPKFVRAFAKVTSKVARANALIDPVVAGARALTVESYNLNPKAADYQNKQWRRALEKARGQVKSSEGDVRRLTRWTPPTTTTTTTTTSTTSLVPN